MLIQDFKVKPKPVYRRHSEVCRDCIRVEKLYREYPGFKQGVVFYVAQPCRSLLKKPRPAKAYMEIEVDGQKLTHTGVEIKELKIPHIPGGHVSCKPIINGNAVFKINEKVFNEMMGNINNPRKRSILRPRG